MLDDLFNKIQKADVISFDVFDTLVARPYVKPADVFKHLEKIHGAQGFADARILAEQKAWDKYTSADIECTNIDEIYSEIDTKFQKFKSIEQEFELQVCVKNPQIWQAYLYAVKQNKKIIAVSDMYFDTKLIESILGKNGYDKIEKIYVSSDYRKLKSTGNLFNAVLQDFDVKPSKILHIGDNCRGDYNVPKKLGINAWLYEKLLSQYIQSVPRINKFIKQHGDDLGASIIIGLNAIKNAEYLCREVSPDYWNRFGVEYTGPATFAFAQWVQQQSENVKDVIFLARDGYILEKVYNKISVQNTYYIYTPRALNLLLMLNFERTGSFALQHTKTIIDFYKNKSSLLKNAPDIQTGDEGVNFIDKNINTFKKLAKIELENYKKYLEKHNISGKNVVVVDTVSMFYSGQVLLQKFMPNKKITGLYYLVQQDAKDSPFVKTFKPKSHYTPDLSLIEFMMTSPESPIQTVENAKPVYAKNVSIEEQKRQEVTKKLSAGACEFADFALSVFGRGVDLCISSGVLTDYIMNFIDKPSDIDKKMFFEIKFAYDPQHSIYAPIFPQWYAKNKICRKIRVSLLGFITFSYKLFQNKSKYQFCGLTLLICKWSRTSKTYKVFGILPIMKKKII